MAAILAEHVPRRGNAATVALGHLVLWLMRWRSAGGIDVTRCVAVAAPHTSNWDFVVGIAAMLSMRLGAQWLGKEDIFRWPFRRLLVWLGGIPVDRSAPGRVVEGAVQAFRDREALFLTVAPEGTRRKVARWKTGFHRIACAAGVPIVPVVLDYRRREVRLEPAYAPTGDFDADVAALKTRFASEMARYPERY